MTIGKRIKLRRIELGLSADELAERIQKNRATVYRYEGDEIANLTLDREFLLNINKTPPRL